MRSSVLTICCTALVRRTSGSHRGAWPDNDTGTGWIMASKQPPSAVPLKARRGSFHQTSISPRSSMNLSDVETF